MDTATQVITSQPVPTAPPAIHTEVVSDDPPPPYNQDIVITSQPVFENVHEVLQLEGEAEEEEQKRRQQEQCCCAEYDPVDDSYLVYIVCRFFCSPCGYCCRSCAECTDNACESCGNCLHNCCESNPTDQSGNANVNDSNTCCCCSGDCCDGDGGCCDGDGGDSGDCDCNCFD